MHVVFVWSHDKLSVICSNTTLCETWKNNSFTVRFKIPGISYTQKKENNSFSCG